MRYGLCGLCYFLKNGGNLSFKKFVLSGLVFISISVNHLDEEQESNLNVKIYAVSHLSGIRLHRTELV